MGSKLILLFWLIFHPVHVTLTSIDYVPEDNSFEVFVKLYLDDFLLDAEHDEDDFLNSEKSKSREIIENYINQKLIIKVNDRISIGKVNNFEVLDDEVKVYMKYETSEKPKELLVQNLIMTELYSDQLNFLIIKIDKFEEGFIFTSEITEHIFKIEN